MSILSRSAAAFVLAVMLALPGCAWLAGRRPTPEIFPEERRSVDELVQSLASRSGEIKSLRSVAKVYYEGSDGKGSFQEVILVRRPDRLRLETLSPMGAVLIVTASADEITGFHTREGVFYRGKTSRQNLYRYTQIPLGLAELTSVLLGLPPNGAEEKWIHEGSSIVRVLGGGWKDAIIFHPAQLVPIRWRRFNPEGQVELAAQFSDFSKTAAGEFPMKIILESPTQKRRLEITYQEPELNVDLASALFVQKKPDQAREVPLDPTGG